MTDAPKILQPQHIVIHPMAAQATIPLMDLKRAPIPYRCACGQEDFLVLPQWPGALVWRCVQCRKDNRLDFPAATGDEQMGSAIMRFRRRPLLHDCGRCKVEDWITLPDGAGELRWGCGCGKLWAIRFRPEVEPPAPGHTMLADIYEVRSSQIGGSADGDADHQSSGS